MSILVFVLLISVLFGFYALYVSLMKKRNKLSEASADIDVQLKKRYDLLPNILNIAAKFMDHEKDLLEKIVELRTKAVSQNFSQHPQERLMIENELESNLKNFWISVENYPDLKSNQTMVQAMQTFSEVEEHIAASRRFYNSAVADLKNAVEIFPSSLVASWLGIKLDMPFFKAQEFEKTRIDVKDYFRK